MVEKEVVIIREVVVKEPLTKEMIDGGVELLRRLDEANSDVQAVLWLYRSEANRWRLILAFPKVWEEGSLKRYQKIRSVLDEIPDEMPKVHQFDISVIDTDDRLIRALRKGRSILEGKFPKHVFSVGGNEYYVEEAYIYRLI